MKKHGTNVKMHNYESHFIFKKIRLDKYHYLERHSKLEVHRRVRILIFLTKTTVIWDKVFKNGPSKVCVSCL